MDKSGRVWRGENLKCKAKGMWGWFLTTSKLIVKINDTR